MKLVIDYSTKYMGYCVFQPINQLAMIKIAGPVDTVEKAQQLLEKEAEWLATLKNF